MPLQRPFLVAITGPTGSETLRRPEEALADLGVPEKDTQAMVDLVSENGIAKIPDDAASLLLWLSRARAALCDGTQVGKDL